MKPTKVTSRNFIKGVAVNEEDLVKELLSGLKREKGTVTATKNLTIKVIILEQ